MKKILICLFLISICGFSSVTNDIKESIDKACDNDKTVVRYYVNNYTSLMEFYLPSDVQEMEANEFSIQLKYDESPLVMNVNVAGIITEKYYNTEINESMFDPSKLFYSRNGVYVDNSNTSNSYSIGIYSYLDNYLVALCSRKVNLYAYCDLNTLAPMCSRMMVLAKGAKIREDAIVSKYSSKGVIDYQKKQVDLFENVLPVNGRIDDLLIQNNESADDIVVE